MKAKGLSNCLKIIGQQLSTILILNVSNLILLYIKDELEYVIMKNYIN